jgi:hypothetical protein
MTSRMQEQKNRGFNKISSHVGGRAYSSLFYLKYPFA